MRRRLYLDLDGVFVDFIHGVLTHFKRTDIAYSEIQWSVWEQLGLTQKEFWSPLGYDFWANLEWMPDGRQLLTELEVMTGGNFVLLSSPCDTDGCRDGKRDWVKKNMPPYLHRKLVLANNKADLAHPAALLIDDSDHNVEEYRKAGGSAILLPRPWNQLRGHTRGGTITGDYWKKLIDQISAWYYHDKPIE